MSHRGAVVVLADDLTGALDTTVAFGRGRGPAEVWLRPPLSAGAGAPAVLGVDLGTRDLDAATAARVAAEAVAAAPGGRLIYRKVDSLLRGQPGVEVRATLAAAADRFGGRWTALVAPAYPDTGRTTVDGLVRLAGEAPVDAAGRFRMAGLDTATVALTAVRRGVEHLAGRLARLVESDVAAVVLDAEAVDDLRVIATAGRRLDVPSGRHNVLWVGSAGLAGVLARAADIGATRAVPDGPDTGWRGDTTHRPVLAVVGATHPAARRQLELLLAHRKPTYVPLAAAALRDQHGSTAVGDMAFGSERDNDLVVSIDDGDGPDSPEDSRLSEALAARLAPVAHRFGCLILTGGTNASAVLRAMDVNSLRLSGELEPGVVVSTPTGDPSRLVVTKSGGFGDDHCLVRAFDTVTRRWPTGPTTTAARTI